MTLQQNIEAVQRRMAEACRRAHRDPASAQLVAVSKTHPPETIRIAFDSGLRIFGESRVQEASAKIPLCPAGISWHFVGHLQRNKAKHAVTLFDVIHSVDSWRLLETLDRLSQEAGRRLDVLLEVNVSGERSKFGLSPEEVPGVLDRARRLVSVNVAGLMTIPPFFEDVEKTRPFFRKLREWRDAYRAQTGFPLNTLSMGMTHDFEIAIEEGATCVRIGTAIFGERPKAPWRAKGEYESFAD